MGGMCRDVCRSCGGLYGDEYATCLSKCGGLNQRITTGGLGDDVETAFRSLIVRDKTALLGKMICDDYSFWDAYTEVVEGQVIDPQIGGKSLAACNNKKCTTSCKIQSTEYPYCYAMIEIYNGNNISKTVDVTVTVVTPYGEEMLEHTSQINPNTQEEVLLGPLYFREYGDYTLDQVYASWI